MDKESSMMRKIIRNGEITRKAPTPELALSAEITKWKPTEYMKALWFRKPYS